MSVSRETLEREWLALLESLEPTAHAMVNVLPQLAKQRWQQRSQRIANEQRVLSTRLAERQTLRRKMIEARVTGQITEADFEDVKRGLTEEIQGIEDEQRALLSEAVTMDELTADVKRQNVDLAKNWKHAALAERQEVQTSLFPEGLLFSEALRFFEPGNSKLQNMVFAGILQAIGEATEWNDFNAKFTNGRDDWI